VKSEEVDWDELMDDVKNDITSKNDKAKDVIVKRITSMEKNNRVMLKSQQTKVIKIQKMLSDFISAQTAKEAETKAA